jgi:hypothetical protein
LGPSVFFVIFAGHAPRILLCTCLMKEDAASPVAESLPGKLVGKPFGEEVLAAIRYEIEQAVPRTRSEIARRVCSRLDWKSPGGQYQWMSARVALLRLHRAGLIELPAPTRGNGNGCSASPRQATLLESLDINQSVHELSGLVIHPVRDRADSAVYNGLMARYHYLGYRPMAGAQVRYLIACDRGLLGAIGFGASAWKTAPRDRFIGWSREVRHRTLHRIVNNHRFLILPSVRCPNLASKVLGWCSRDLPKEFLKRYGYAPVLLETFVESDRFTGHCYRAANWIYIGQTQGRGKRHIRNTPGVAPKDIWLYPLQRDFRRILQEGRNR